MQLNVHQTVFSYPQPDGSLLKAKTCTVSWMLHHSKYKPRLMNNEVALLFYCLQHNGMNHLKIIA